ncbi:MAG: HAMP domain-containing histidine kinase [Bacteroidales bacterium]|jgi:signal transduction histidine kinase|nr:HAMP domain-containing histidine kinase [Bacteroidales bacterium]MCH3940540.1 HAMP domain-containing histidine kinase [Bacteroidales bacterium]MCI2135915.1 HAMP domain-containing histidine kinase [Bacteroidales bacterium]MDY6377866.1 HAMP domain-containing sensor histidine kinase [Bacteroidales bacterium]MEE3431073.1 HAMP domain-containing sensor histidine kinase [Candidatus Cryptobacteroides sp.]
MKFPSRRIVILLILSLAALFGYQIYWLSGLYRSSIKSKESEINLALQKADYAEMMERLRTVSASGRHGSLDLDTGWSEDHVVSHVTVRTDPIVINEDGSKSISVTTVQVDRNAGEDNDNSQYAYAISNSQESTDYYQRGMHAGVDILAEVNFHKLDSLLSMMLDDYGLNVPHRLQMLTDSTMVATISTSGYEPSGRARNYDFIYGKTLADKYELTIEPLTGIVFREMSGVIAASLILFLMLAFSFWFLVHAMLKQKSLEEMKSDFTNNITHELKTPVAVAYAANDALLNFEAGNDPAKRREYLEISQSQLKKLEGMIEQILSMSMESRKTFELRKEDITLKPLLQTLAEQHRLSAEKPCSFHIEAEDDLIIHADRFHFGNVISNLIENAIKYSGDGVNIAIRAKTTSGGVEISVKDNGTGIAPDKQKHIFDKFYRVPTGDIHDVKGYGLGLYYAKTMVEKHGGTISVSSTLGKGSEFRIFIPQSFC